MKRLLTFIMLVSLATWCGAVEKRAKGSYSGMDMFDQHLALSLQLGVAIPTGDFADQTVFGSTFDNASAGGGGAFQIEYFVTRSFSVGLDFSGGVFEDDNFDNTDKMVNNYQLFGRVVFPVQGSVFPYAKFGLGLSTITSEEEFFYGTFIADSDPGLSLALDGGIIWRVSNAIGLTGGFRYDAAFLEEAEIEETNVAVGFDPGYFSINLGLSFYLRP